MMPLRLIGRWHALVLICLLGTNLSYVAAQTTTPRTSQLGGWVYVDRNNDGIINFANDPNPELAIDNVTVSLYSLNGQQETLVSSLLTDQYGRYLFTGLAANTYTLKQTQPVDFVDGIDTLGSFSSLNGQPVPGNASIGTMTNNVFSNIVLPANVIGNYYNFGELGLMPGSVSKRYLLGSSPIMEFATEETLVPEPATCTLALSCLVGAWALGRRRRN